MHPYSNPAIAVDARAELEHEETADGLATVHDPRPGVRRSRLTGPPRRFGPARVTHLTRRLLRGTVLLGLGAATGLPLASAPHAQAAATFTVDRFDDPDPATAMACTDTPDDCSLRGAIIAANTADGPDEIILPAGTYTLTRTGNQDDAAATGDLDITDDLDISGAGARSTIVTGKPSPYVDRIFHNLDAAKTTITGLTITGGNGGGVLNQGDLTLERVAVMKNTDNIAVGAIYGDGGTLTVTSSTVSGNSAPTVGGLAQVNGAATITNSTISGNRATAPDGFGGGVYVVQAVVNIRNSTIVSNKSARLGGGIMTNVGSTVLVKNSIVAGNSQDNCDFAQFGGIIRSQGNNLSSDRSCRFTEPTDKRNVSPRLGPLENNGGPTDTRALLAGSPALDAGTSRGCPAADQRGVSRPQGLRCDIGAFERRNRRPVARNDSYRGREDTTLRVSPRGVLRNDRDPDGDRLRASVVRRPANGRLTLKANGSFTYRPRQDFHGTVRFRYRASDAYGGRDTATVTITIAPRRR